MEWSNVKILAIIFIMFVGGCAKDNIILEENNNTPPPGLTIRKIDGDFRKEAVYNEKLISFLTAIEGENLYFDVIAEKFHNFEIGQVLYISHPYLAEDVIFKRVKSFKKSQNLIEVECDDVGFNQFFSWLDIDLSYVYQNEKLQFRSGEIETRVFDMLTVECSGFNPNQYPRVTPEFGVEGEILIKLNADFEAGSFTEFDYKFRDVRLVARKNIEVNSQLACSAEVSSGDYELPPITITLKGVIIRLDSRMSVGVKGGFDVGGRLEYDMGVSLAHPFSLDMKINPNTLPFPYTDFRVASQPYFLPDLNFDFDLKDISGQCNLTFTKTYLWEFSLYRSYDFFNVFLKFKLPKVDLSFEIEETNEGINVNSELDFSLVLAPGFQLNLGDIGGVNLNIDQEVEFPIYEQNAFRKKFPLPCSVRFRNADFVLNCFDDNDREGVLMNFRVDSNNGSPLGFRLNVDGRELGIFGYNSNHDVEISSNFVRSNSKIEIRDAAQPGCRFVQYENHPCGTRAYCSDEPIVDSRDLQEYCYISLADGKQWMSSNLLYSESGSLGLCYEGNTEYCDQLGRYFLYDELESGNVCPTGWKIPTMNEWSNMLDVESTGANRIRHLLAPNLPNFGNVSNELTNGFNIVPSGQYQGWKENLPLEERFSGSVFGNDAQFAMFWTSTPLDEASNNQFAEGGAMAVLISQSGNYKYVATSKKAGLTCRCIKN